MRLNKYWLITLLYILLISGVTLGLSLAVRRLPDVGRSGIEKELWVYAGHPVSQTFTSGHNGLNVLTVYLRNVALRNQSPFIFSLVNSAGDPVRTISLTGYNIGDGDNVRFQFPPIPDSKGQTYTVNFTSGSPENIAIGVGFSSQTQSLAYQAYYFPQNRLEVISSTLSSLIDSLFNWRFLLLFILVSALAWFSVSSLFRPDK